jgi:hypothetical protein
VHGSLFAQGGDQAVNQAQIFFAPAFRRKITMKIQCRQVMRKMETDWVRMAEGLEGNC